MLNPDDIVAWLDGELDENECKRVEALMREHPDEFDQLFDQHRIDLALRVVLGRPEQEQRVRESILTVVRGMPLPELEARVRDTTFITRSPLASAVARITQWFNRQRLIAMGAVAAVALIAFFVINRPTRPGPRLTMMTDGVSLIRDGRPLTPPLSPSGGEGARRAGEGDSGRTGTIHASQFVLSIPLFPGDELKTTYAGFAEFELADGSRIEVSPGTTVALSRPPTRNEIHVTSGTVLVHARPQRPENPLRVTSRHGIASVIGTVFTLQADDRQLRVDVREGAVKVQSAPTETPVPVTPGESAVATAGNGVLVFVANRDAKARPFSADSPWNTPMGSGARFEPVSEPLIAPDERLTNTAELRPLYSWDPGAPERRIESGNQEPIIIPVPGAWKLPPSTGFSAMGVLTRDGESVLEFRQIEPLPNGNLKARFRGRTNLRGTGFAPDSRGVCDFGGSFLAGALREGELTGGIGHALALLLPADRLNRRHADGKPFVWPAARASLLWRQRYGERGNLRLGNLLAIPPSADIRKLGFAPGTPGFELARALQDYGAYITDATDDEIRFIFVDEKPPADFDALVTKLLPHLQVVTNNSPQTIGGGGIRRRLPVPVLPDGQ